MSPLDVADDAPAPLRPPLPAPCGHRRSRPTAWLVSPCPLEQQQRRRRHRQGPRRRARRDRHGREPARHRHDRARAPGPIATRRPRLPHLRRVPGPHPQTGLTAPEGGLATPLPYTIYERSTYSVVLNAVWRDPARATEEPRRSPERARQPQARPLVPANPARRPPHRRLPPRPQPRDPREHGPPRRLLPPTSRSAAPTSTIPPRSRARLLPGDRTPAARHHERHGRLSSQARRLRQGLHRRPPRGSGRQEPGRQRRLRQPRAQRPERQLGSRALPQLLTATCATSAASSATPRPRPTPRCRAASCPSTSPSRWRPSSSTPSCSAPGPRWPTSPTSPTTASTTTALARPRASTHRAGPPVVLVPPPDLDRGLHAQMLRTPRPTAPSPAGPSTPPAPTPPPPRTPRCRKGNVVVQSLRVLLGGEERRHGIAGGDLHEERHKPRA